MNRAECRYRADIAVSKRVRLLRAYGEQKGTLYERHTSKLRTSHGYTRKGNVRHYVSLPARRYYERET